MAAGGLIIRAEESQKHSLMANSTPLKSASCIQAWDYSEHSGKYKTGTINENGQRISTYFTPVTLTL